MGYMIYVCWGYNLLTDLLLASWDLQAWELTYGGYIGIYRGYNPLILIIDPNFQRNIQVHPSGNTPSLRSFPSAHHGSSWPMVWLQQMNTAMEVSSFDLCTSSDENKNLVNGCIFLVFLLCYSYRQVQQGNNFNPKVQVHAQVVIHKVVEFLATLRPAKRRKKWVVLLQDHRSKIYKNTEFTSPRYRYTQ